jgi:ribonuclease VapC
MILDTSAVLAWLADEPSAEWVDAQLRSTQATELRMSWVNVAELCMVSARIRAHATEAILRLLDEFDIERLAPDEAVVALAVEARSRFRINFGDCFAYAHAKLLDEPLLTLDADFLRTDLARVLHPQRS